MTRKTGLFVLIVFGAACALGVLNILLHDAPLVYIVWPFLAFVWCVFTVKEARLNEEWRDVAEQYNVALKQLQDLNSMVLESEAAWRGKAERLEGIMAAYSTILAPKKKEQA